MNKKEIDQLIIVLIIAFLVVSFLFAMLNSRIEINGECKINGVNLDLSKNETINFYLINSELDCKLNYNVPTWIYLRDKL